MKNEQEVVHPHFNHPLEVQARGELAQRIASGEIDLDLIKKQEKADKGITVFTRSGKIEALVSGRVAFFDHGPVKTDESSRE